MFYQCGAVLSGWLGYVMVDTHHDFWQGAILILDNHKALVNAHHVPLLVKTISHNSSFIRYNSWHGLFYIRNTIVSPSLFSNKVSCFV